MKIGLLWHDDTASSLEEKIRNAVLHYRDKYGQGWPDTCYVHPSALGLADQAEVHVVEERPGREDNGYFVPECTVRVLPSPYVAASYFWIGREERVE